MDRPDVVHYLQEHLQKFPLEELRSQLASEGVTPAEFDAALKLVAAAKARAKRKALSQALMILGVLSIAAAALMLYKPSTRRAPAAPVIPSTAAPAFVGRSGWVVHLPEGYAAVTTSGDPSKTAEVVYFCKAGMDGTTLLDEGLFGPLGIVRARVEPNPFGQGLAGLEALTRYANGAAQRSGAKTTIKNIQISSLRGVQILFDVPNAHVEAYVLGQSSLYGFYAGQDDEIFRGLLNSLRETASED